MTFPWRASRKARQRRRWASAIRARPTFVFGWPKSPPWLQYIERKQPRNDDRAVEFNVADLIPAEGYVHGRKPTSIDAGIYGFLANILLMRPFPAEPLRIWPDFDPAGSTSRRTTIRQSLSRSRRYLCCIRLSKAAGPGVGLPAGSRLDRQDLEGQVTSP